LKRFDLLEKYLPSHKSKASCNKKNDIESPLFLLYTNDRLRHIFAAAVVSLAATRPPSIL
jgi:hypothetical protein